MPKHDTRCPECKKFTTDEDIEEYDGMCGNCYYEIWKDTMAEEAGFSSVEEYEAYNKEKEEDIEFFRNIF